MSKNEEGEFFAQSIDQAQLRPKGNFFPKTTMENYAAAGATDATKKPETASMAPGTVPALASQVS